MKRIALASILALSMLSTASAQKREVIGYFPSWKWSSRTSLMSYDKIPFRKVTIVDYAFWRPLTDGSIEGINPKGDSLILLGESGYEPLVTLAHKHGVKVMLSIGGWDDSENFPAVASTEELRVRFARACSDAIRRFDFDGIDIDWEYPGYVEHKGGPADRAHATRLFEILRDTLDRLGTKLGRHLLLSAAFAATSEHLTGCDFGSLSHLLDMLDVMTYDYHGDWSPLSGYNAPLYGPSPGDTLNIDATFRLFTEQLGVPADKLNLGIPFYGHSFAQCAGLNAPFHGVDTSLSPEGDLCYYALLPYITTYRHWDDGAKVPYLVLTDKKTFVSYDDEVSVGLKAQYILAHNARGVIIWELTGDYLPDGTTPLLDVLSRRFAGDGSQ